MVSSLTYSIAEDVIVETLQPDTTVANTSRNSDQNIGRMYYYAFSGAYPVKIAKWWSNTSNVTAYYSQYKGTLGTAVLDRASFAAELNVTNTFTLPKAFTAELSTYYQTPMVWGAYNLRSLYGINCGVQKAFLDKKLTVKLAFNDWFRSSSPRVTTEIEGFREDFVALRDTRVCMLSLVYRFGQTSPAARRHRGGAEDEVRRASGGGG
jgi:hypothetical protein